LTLTNINNQKNAKAEDKMKNKKLLIFVLILAFTCLIVACENPIIERWWVDSDRDPGHGGGGGGGGETIIIEVPGPPGPPVLIPGPPPEFIFVEQIVIETIIEEHWETIIAYIPVLVDQPPTVIAEHIEIIAIDFIIFAGNADGFNAGPFGGAITSLTPAEISRNNEIVHEFAMELVTQWDKVQAFYPPPPGQTSADNPEIPYFLLLHGHANPVDNTPGEGLELRNLSMHRANAAQNAITGQNFEPTFPSPPTFLPNFPSYGTRAQTLRPPGRVEFTVTPFQIRDPSNVLVNRTAGAGATLSPAEIASLTDLISIKGYGGGRTLTGGNPTYAALNRRVEAILFTIHRVPQTLPPIPR